MITQQLNNVVYGKHVVVIVLTPVLDNYFLELACHTFGDPSSGHFLYDHF